MQLSQGERIKQVRKDKKLNQSQLARAIGVSAPTISQVESGKFTLKADLAQKISKLYDVDLGWLLFGERSSVLNEGREAYQSEPVKQVLQLEILIKDNKIIKIDAVDVSDNSELKQEIKKNSKSIKALAELITANL